MKKIAIQKLPDAPGIYFFIGARGKVLYIGKAGSLHDRVRSYFTKDLPQSRSPAIGRMIEEARNIRWKTTDSVLEALILEAKLIRKHQPKYNVRERDDKSFNYVAITDEAFPCVLVIRGRELFGQKTNKLTKLGKLKAVYGPFPRGGQLREALKIIRKIFPFRDTCKPCIFLRKSAFVPRPSGPGSRRHNRLGILRTSAGCKPCFNRQLGLCPGVCTGEISKEEYQKTIRNIQLLFEGKKELLIKRIKQRMSQAAKRRDFERAAELRNTILALKHIQDISLIKNDIFSFQSSQELWNENARKEKRIGQSIGQSIRIEGYDIAHTAGEEVVGVMTVVENGEMKKSDYRMFTMKTALTGGDVPALKELLERRLRHDEWPLPDLVVVDGGKAQINSAERILRARRPTQNKRGITQKTLVVGVVKDEHHRPKRIIGPRDLIREYEREILLANAEAHRFALKFHRARLRRSFKDAE